MERGDITMSRKEIKRLEIIASLETGKTSNSEAAKLLRLSRRQVIRIRKNYRSRGALGLISKRRGTPSSNRISEEIKKQVVELIKTRYIGFGPTFLREKLIENHGLKLSKETLRGLMIKNDLWETKR